MKKGITSLLLILTCISMSGCGKEKKSPVDIYVNVIQNYLSEGKTDFSVSFINVNDDDIKEMVIILGDSEMDGGYLYTIKDGKAVQVVAPNQEYFGQYGGFSYLENSNIFVTEYESTTDNQISQSIIYYSMKNGEAICNDATESVSEFAGDNSIYYVNEKQVDSTEFDSIAEKYSLSDMATAKYSESVHVTDKEMEKIYKAYKDEK